MMRRLPAFLLLMFCIPALAQDTAAFKMLTLPGSSNDLNAVAMSPARFKRMAVAGWDNSILVYTSDAPYTLVQKLSGHTAQVNCLSYNLSGNMMASGSGDMSIRIYDSLYRYLPMKEDAALRHQSAVTSLMFDRSGKFIFSADRDGKLILWDALLQKPIKAHNLGISVTDLCMSASPVQIFVAGDKQIKLIGLANGNVIKTLDGHTDVVNTLAISNNLQYLLSGSNDKTARLWNLKTWKPLFTLKTDSWKVQAVAFTDDSKYCVIACNDGAVMVYETATGNLIGKASYPDINIRDIAVSKDLQYLLAAPKLREGSEFGARLLPAMIPLPSKAVPVKMVSPMQKSLDSIMAIRPLNKQDSVKYKSLLMPKTTKPVNGNNSGNKQSSGNKNGLDSAVIYKTPMNPQPKKK